MCTANDIFKGLSKAFIIHFQTVYFSLKKNILTITMLSHGDGIFTVRAGLEFLQYGLLFPPWPQRPFPCMVASSATSLPPVGTSGATTGVTIAAAATAVRPFSHSVGDSGGLLRPPLPQAVLRLSSCRRRTCCSATVHHTGHVDLVHYFFRHFGVGGSHGVDRIRSPQL